MRAPIEPQKIEPITYQIEQTQGMPNVPWKIIFVRTYNNEEKRAMLSK